MKSKSPRPNFSSGSVLFSLGILLTMLMSGTNIFLSNFLPPLTKPMWYPALEEQSLITDTMENGTGPNILHLVTSRFMQLQSNLTTLGYARLKLFETFCLPSMLFQDVDNFVWFLMVDPDLDIGLLNRLKEIMSPYPNFYVVAMNNRTVTPENFNYALKGDLFMTGDTKLLSSLMFDEDRPLLLETRLDADDGLNGKTLGRIQETALGLPYDESGWQIICNDIHFEWRNDDITTPGEKIDSAGQMRIVMESLCITAGYTLVRHRPKGSLEFPPWPRIGHHLISREWPKCLGKGNHTSECWTRLPKYPAALRSRTITSAGMSRVQTTAEDRFYDNATELMWTYAERDFGISQDAAIETSKYMKANLRDILEDNLRGQCTFGHSCKSSSKEKLTTLLEVTMNATSQ